MKVHGSLERWPHDYKEMKLDVEIMTIDEEQKLSRQRYKQRVLLLPV